jgi:hypothetical protein
MYIGRLLLLLLQGITTSVTLVDVAVAETKHVGVLILHVGALADPVEVNMARWGPLQLVQCSCRWR